MVNEKPNLWDKPAKDAPRPKKEEIALKKKKTPMDKKV